MRLCWASINPLWWQTKKEEDDVVELGKLRQELPDSEFKSNTNQVQSLHLVYCDP